MSEHSDSELLAGSPSTEQIDNEDAAILDEDKDENVNGAGADEATIENEDAAQEGEGEGEGDDAPMEGVEDSHEQRADKPLTLEIEQTTIIVSPFCMADLKSIDDFYRVLYSTEKFNIEYEGGKTKTGTITMEFPGKRETYFALFTFHKKPFSKELRATYPGSDENLLEILRDKKEEQRKAKALQQDLIARSLYINKLPPDTSEEMLKEKFPDCVNITIPSVPEGKEEGEEDRHAVLEFENKAAALKFLVANKEVEINEVKCSLSRKKGGNPPKDDGKGSPRKGNAGRQRGKGPGQGRQNMRDSKRQLEERRDRRGSGGRRNYGNWNQQQMPSLMMAQGMGSGYGMGNMMGNQRYGMGMGGMSNMGMGGMSSMGMGGMGMGMGGMGIGMGGMTGSRSGWNMDLPMNRRSGGGYYEEEDDGWGGRQGGGYGGRQQQQQNKRKRPRRQNSFSDGW